MEPKLIYSEPVREIMGKPPRRLIAWGSSMLFIIFILFIIASGYIKYPDIVPGQIQITSQHPPVTMTSRVDGRLIELLVSDNEMIPAGKLLAVMESSASFTNILRLEELANNGSKNFFYHPDSLDSFTGLGEVQQPFTQFRNAYTRLWNFRENDYLGNRIRALHDEIYAIRKYISELEVKEELYRNDLALESLKFRRDSILHLSGTISDADYEKSSQALLVRKISLQQIAIDIMSETISLTRKEQEIQDVSIIREEELQELIVSMAGALDNLSASVEMWKNRYLMISPVDGTAVFAKFWSRDQYVYEGEPVMTIVPADQGDIIGRVAMGMQRSGKVVPGKDVNIKLSGFPYLEYGLVRGVVRSKSMVANGDEYIVEVDLPEGLKTIYGEEIPFTQNMTGLAEIITSDLTLLRKIIDPVKYLILKDRTSEKNYDFE